MRTSLGRFLLLWLFLLVSLPNELLCQIPNHQLSPTVSYHYDTLSRNGISMWTSNIGRMSHNPLTDGNGFEWPRGSGRLYIYEDGLLYSGLLSGRHHAGGSLYMTAWQAGHIYPDGTPQDPDDQRARQYRVRNLDAETYMSLPILEQERLKVDYDEWPAKFGAPWNDVNADGSYDPDFPQWLNDRASADGPVLLGDEQLWCVMNDLDTSRMRTLFVCRPIGLEMQTTVWAYDLPDCRNRAIFTKHRLIHKGTEPIDSLHLSIWSDPDVGSPFDDYVGIDTTLQMAYVYNAYPYDSLHGTIGVLGYLLLQGPVVDAPGSVARFNGRDVSNKRNLPFTAFTMYANAVLPYRDPCLKDFAGAFMLFNNAQGQFSFGQPFIDPHTGDTTTLMLAGDPVTGTGWLDRDNLPPGDRRLLASMGPMTMAVGDTQEVIYARIVAEGGGPAEDIVALRETARCIVQTFRDTPVDKGPPSLPDSFSITSISPNPSTPGGQFTITLSDHRGIDAYYTIECLDLLGRKVMRSEVRATEHLPTRLQLTVPTGMASSLYLLRITSGNEVHTGSVLVLH